MDPTTELTRIWERLGAIEERLRKVENIEGPAAQRLIDEFYALKEQVRKMDVEGTHIMQVRIDALDEDVEEMRDDAKGLRITIRSALITAALALSVQVIIFLVNRVTS